MTRFGQAVVEGLGNGSVYALLALGFVIIYKATKVISFAQPALMVVGGLWVSFLAVELGWPFWVALAVAAVATAVIGLLLERLALRPLVGEPVFIVAIVTLALDVILRTLANRYIGTRIRTVGDPWGIRVLDVGGVAVQQRYLGMIVVTVVVVTALVAFFRYSRYGLAMRAAAFDQETAMAQGVSVGFVFALSWAIAAALAAVAGMFVGTGQGIDQGTWTIALKALPAIILGGLDSIGGAVIGGLAIGVVEALVGTYQAEFAPWLGNNFSVVSPYVLMLLVLLVRPYGLFGTPEVERV